jgi:large subunit ribosomal protein L46
VFFSSSLFSLLFLKSYEELVKQLPFEPASRITEADKTNDRKSPDRRLQDSLYLIVKRKRNNFQWQFPQGKWLEGETIRQVR